MSDSDKSHKAQPHPIQSRLSLRQSASPSSNQPPPTIDLNADLGEGFPNDQALLDVITSASLCCGAHASTPSVIRQTLRHAAARGILIGAHPGYPDREGFGRRDQNLTPTELVDLITAQITALVSMAAQENATVRYLKPHGALYNQAQREPHVARAVIESIRPLGWPLLGQPGTLLETEARNSGVIFIAEGFPDRRYRTDGSLMPRNDPTAVLHEPHEIEEQVIRLIEEGRVATLCIHGDEPHAVSNAAIVRQALTHRGISVCSFVNGSR